MSARADALRADDAHARALAQFEFTQPLVIEAGAGTGKTATLVARVLAWALGPGWQRAEAALRRHGDAHADATRVAARVLDRIVAITFTDAAAAEMARRVDDALAQLVADELPVGVLAEVLPSDATLRAERAGALRGALDHLQVQTIHAWCRRLLAAYPLAAGVHPGFQVDADGRLAAAAARRALETRLRVAYTENDAHALALAERACGPAELEAALVALLERGIGAEELAADPASSDRLGALLARARAALEALRDAGGGALSGVTKYNARKIADAVDDCLAALAVLPSREALASFADAVRASFPKSLLDHLKRWSKQEFSTHEQEAFDSGADAIARASAWLAPLLAHVQALDLAHLDAVRGVLAGALADAEQSLRRSGTLGFGQLLTGAARLLSEHREVAASVRGRIDQLLVDEFQDTDRRQCTIVASLALEGAPASRPGLFLVGDPKQSIYGWREADLAAYEEFVQGARAAGGTLHRLSVNHRSTHAILDEVERVVSPVMRPEPGLQPAFEPLVARPDAPEGLAVEYWLPARLDGEPRAPSRTPAADANAREARALARHLLALHEQGVPWSEMAVLTRSRGDWDIYLGALRAHAVPFRVEGDRSYYRRREIIEAAAWVRCILDPDDVLALVTALRSAAVGVPDAAWLGLFGIGLPARAAALDGAASDPLRELARDVVSVAADLPPGVPGLERVRGWEQSLLAALEAVAALRGLFETAPPDVFVEALRDALCFEASEAARFLGPWRAANLERFFRGLSARLSEGAGTAELLRELRQAVAEEEPSEEMQPRDLEADGVRVLTLHGAKGLDFACVFLVQLHKGSARVAPEVEAARVEGRLEYRVLGAATPGFDQVVATQKSVESAERVRLLYVGMTRARERLVLSGLTRECQLRPVECHAQLLEKRDPGPPDWRILALDDDAPAPPRRESAARSEPDLRLLRAEAEQLRAASERARERMALSRGARASAFARDDGDEGGAVRSTVVGEAGPEVARLVGSAVHRALERLDLFAPDAEQELVRLEADALAELAARAAPGDLPAATARLRDLIARFGRGALFARLQALREHVVARELPVLLPPQPGDGAQGFVAGSIDLVLRDPASDELVVVDYKTDAAEPDAPEPSRHDDYDRQGSVYRRALAEALGLATLPRVELWWIAADRAEPIA